MYTQSDPVIAVVITLVPMLFFNVSSDPESGVPALGALTLPEIVALLGMGSDGVGSDEVGSDGVGSEGVDSDCGGSKGVGSDRAGSTGDSLGESLGAGMEIGDSLGESLGAGLELGESLGQLPEGAGIGVGFGKLQPLFKSRWSPSNSLW
jgi:hypothetical protein